MAFDKTIQMYIFEGNPNGRIMCELSNWNGRVYKVSRNELTAFSTRKDSENTGIYFYLGKMKIILIRSMSAKRKKCSIVGPLRYCLLILGNDAPDIPVGAQQLIIHLAGDIAPGGGQQIADLMNDELDVLIDGLNSIRHPQDLTFFRLPLLYGKTGKTQGRKPRFCAALPKFRYQY